MWYLTVYVYYTYGTGTKFMVLGRLLVLYYTTKLVGISQKYHFGGIFPLIRQYLPKIPPHIPPVTYLRTRSYVLNKPQTQ